MQEWNDSAKKRKHRFESQWILFILASSILFTLTTAFLSPIFLSSADTLTNVTPTTDVALQITDEMKGFTPTPEPGTQPPTPEEIGSTDGIIIWGGILVTILLIGILRERFLRKKKY